MRRVGSLARIGGPQKWKNPLTLTTIIYNETQLVVGVYAGLELVDCYFFVRETKGLNDLEKKELYYPKDKKDVVHTS